MSNTQMSAGEMVRRAAAESFKKQMETPSQVEIESAAHTELVRQGKAEPVDHSPKAMTPEEFKGPEVPSTFQTFLAFQRDSLSYELFNKLSSDSTNSDLDPSYDGEAYLEAMQRQGLQLDQETKSRIINAQNMQAADAVLEDLPRKQEQEQIMSQAGWGWMLMPTLDDLASWASGAGAASVASKVAKAGRLARTAAAVGTANAVSAAATHELYKDADAGTYKQKQLVSALTATLGSLYPGLKLRPQDVKAVMKEAGTEVNTNANLFKKVTAKIQSAADEVGLYSKAKADQIFGTAKMNHTDGLIGTADSINKDLNMRSVSISNAVYKAGLDDSIYSGLKVQNRADEYLMLRNNLDELNRLEGIDPVQATQYLQSLSPTQQTLIKGVVDAKLGEQILWKSGAKQMTDTLSKYHLPLEFDGVQLHHLITDRARKIFDEGVEVTQSASGLSADDIVRKQARIAELTAKKKADGKLGIKERMELENLQDSLFKPSMAVPSSTTVFKKFNSMQEAIEHATAEMADDMGKVAGDSNVGFNMLSSILENSVGTGAARDFAAASAEKALKSADLPDTLASKLVGFSKADKLGAFARNRAGSAESMQWKIPEGTVYDLRRATVNDPVVIAERTNHTLAHSEALRRVEFNGSTLADAKNYKQYLDELAESMRNAGVDEADITKRIQYVDNAMTGKPTGDALSQELRNLQTLARSMQLGGSGILNVSEYAQVAKAMGLMQFATNFVKTVPDLFRNLKNLTPNEASTFEQYLKDVGHTIGYKEPYIAKYADDFDSAANRGRFTRYIEALGKETMFLNGAEGIRRQQTSMMAKHIDTTFKQGFEEVLQGKLDGAGVAALRTAGMTDEVIQEFAEGFTKHNGNMRQMIESGYDLNHYAIQAMNSVVLDGLKGMKPRLMETAIGKVLFPYMDFVFSAHNRMLRGTYQKEGGLGVASLMVHQAPLSVMVAATRNIIEGKDPEADLALRTIRSAGALGLFSLPMEYLGESYKSGSFKAPDFASSSPALMGPVTAPFKILKEAGKEEPDYGRIAKQFPGISAVPLTPLIVRQLTQ